jgi:hypothetical protein
MKLPEPVADSFRQQLPAVLTELVEAYQLSNEAAAPQESAPPLLEQAFRQLADAMQRTEVSLSRDQGGNPTSGEDVSTVGEYALELLQQASDWAKQLDLSGISETLQAFTITAARWIALHDGQLFNLETVVDALAQSANRTQDAGELLELYQAMGEVMDATVAAIRQDLEKSNPGRPWRVLLLNRAIVATRTHQPDIMEQAFQLLTGYLPEDAPGFFAQGMEQMDLLNYPPHVRAVMDRYYRKWSVDRSLH